MTVIDECHPRSHAPVVPILNMNRLVITTLNIFTYMFFFLTLRYNKLVVVSPVQHEHLRFHEIYASPVQNTCDRISNH